MTNGIASRTGERLSVGGIELEVVRRGAGRPLRLRHGFQNVDPAAPFLDGLARHAEVPWQPGFGHSPRPADPVTAVSAAGGTAS